MRFDLLDEYSTLVPFGLGVSRNSTFQDPAAPATSAKRGTIASLASHLACRAYSLGRSARWCCQAIGTWSQNTHDSLEHRAAAVVDAPVDRPSAQGHW
jgi:hypothetical protein